MIISENFEIIKKNDSLPIESDGEYLLDKVLVKIKKIISQFDLNNINNHGANFHDVEYKDMISTFKDILLRFIDRMDEYLIKDDIY